jgi:signal transduction histidine kinase
MLHEFLKEHQKEILARSEKRCLELAGVRPSSVQLEKGLPIFYDQLLTVLKTQADSPQPDPKKEKAEMAVAATDANEVAMTAASGRPEEVGLAESAGSHGKELLRLGYTLSHVVHTYGSMCQSITQLATEKKAPITPDEFHDLNRCLDIAIAGAVTEFQTLSKSQENTRENEHLGFLAHELRNALGTVTMSAELIRDGTVGFSGSTGQVFDRGLKRIAELIDKSLMEVRLKVDPTVRPESVQILQLVDQIAVTAGVEARSRKQILEIDVDPSLVVQADQQLIYSAVSNLIQNALKYTRSGGKITVRAKLEGKNVVIEVEDECGGLTNETVDLFKPFEQQNENRKGLGLGLTISKRAISLNHGSISVSNLPGKGCIFKIVLPTELH